MCKPEIDASRIVLPPFQFLPNDMPYSNAKVISGGVKSNISWKTKEDKTKIIEYTYVCGTMIHLAGPIEHLQYPSHSVSPQDPANRT